MEVPRGNPNDALTPYYAGDSLIFIPVVEFYALSTDPELALAKIALLTSPREGEKRGNKQTPPRQHENTLDVEQGR